MRALSQAKFSFVTRGVAGRALRLTTVRRKPAQGDLVVARVVSLGQHGALEDQHGRRVRLYAGDLLVGAYGNRYATDFYEGYVPDGPVTHLLTAGGVIGTVASAHARRTAPTELEVVGALGDAAGTPLNLRDVVQLDPPVASPPPTTVVVVGSAMNSGKTTTVAGVIRGWVQAGLTVGAGKVTGSGSGKDRWVYVDAGAHAIADFLDFGMPSTFGYPLEQLIETSGRIRDALASAGAAAAVLEIADGLLQPQTHALLRGLPDFADAVLLAVGDALGAVAGQAILASAGIEPAALSGIVSASPLATREAERATGLPVLSPQQLAAGAALDVLRPRQRV
jgi:hypothetical protein